MRKTFIYIVIFSFITVVLLHFIWLSALWLLVIILPLSTLGIYDMLQTKHALWRTFPVVGHIRWLVEFISFAVKLRPLGRRYFC